jgi:hypothetical protein
LSLPEEKDGQKKLVRNMNNQNLGNNKLFWVVIFLVAALVVVWFGGKFVIDKVSDRVIQKLQKEYSPSPYGPGFDPDKIDPEKLRPH